MVMDKTIVQSIQKMNKSMADEIMAWERFGYELNKILEDEKTRKKFEKCFHERKCKNGKKQ